VLVKCEAATLHGTTLRTRPEDVSWTVRNLLYEGFFIPATRYLEALSLRATLLERHVRDVFSNIDLLLAPVNSDAVPEFRPSKTQNEVDQEALFSGSARYTRFANYLGTPALTLPCGFTSNGLPSGLQLIGRPYAEAQLLSAGHAFQQATGWHGYQPPCA
jgi:aspartyl-tRNA(Asn)/glutamyl-tRNA(Gln) amidotransferase subunit A